MNHIIGRATQSKVLVEMQRVLFVIFTGVGPMTATSDANEVIQAVDSLEANKGGDCPEQGMTGLYKALLQSVQDSVIHYFSDADVKDFELAQVVLILAKQKRVKINFILSGRCRFSRWRRSTREEPRLGSQDLFRGLAAATGGQVLKTKKNKVSVLVDIIGSKSYATENSDLAEVTKQQWLILLYQRFVVLSLLSCRPKDLVSQRN